MSKGRALAQLIMHMSHLTPVGWGYFACSVVLSGICYPSSKKMIPFFIRKQAKKCYPDFEWIVIPQYSAMMIGMVRGRTNCPASLGLSTAAPTAA